MFDRRALPGTIAGCLALAFAIAAVVTQEPALVLVAGVLTAACVVLVLTLPNRAPVRYKERRDLQEEADKLTALWQKERAKREAEKSAARQQLAELPGIGADHGLAGCVYGRLDDHGRHAMAARGGAAGGKPGQVRIEPCHVEGSVLHADVDVVGPGLGIFLALRERQDVAAVLADVADRLARSQELDRAVDA